MTDQKSFSFEPLPVAASVPPNAGTRPNLVIEAGAGTGKTTRIVREVVQLLLRDPSIVLERIVLMTFTEKAAGEIADRIRAAITDLSTTLHLAEPRWPGDPSKPAIIIVPPDEIETARVACEAHLPRIDRLRSQTIHSFCQNLLRMYPIEAGLTPQFRIAEGYERGRILHEIYGEWLDAELSPGTSEERIAEWRVLYRHYLSFNRLEETLKRLSPAADLIRDESLTLGDPADADRLIRGVILQIKALPEPDVRMINDDVQAEVVGYARKTALPDNGTPDEWIEWFAPIEPALSKMTLRKGKAAVKELLKPLRGETFDKSFLARLRKHPVAEVLRRVASRYFDFVEQKKDERGVVDFDDLLVRTARLLENDRILDEIRGRYDTIFVDEFQDTDRIQARIVDRLARDRREMFVQGKATLVGDPKQSIYAFRSADPETYRDTVDAFRAGEAKHEYLDVQHRSDPILLDALNTMFSVLFPERPLDDPNVFTPVYTRLLAARDKLLPDVAPRVRFVLTPPANESKSLEVEAEALAGWIATRYTGEPGELRGIAILMRRSTHFQLFADALERRGIAAIMPPAGSFLDQPSVVDLTAVLRAVSHTFDRAAQISAARSPYFGLTDDEIFSHMFSCERGIDGCCPYGRFLATIRRWQRDARHASVLDVIDRILGESPIEALHEVSQTGLIARAHLERVLELAATFDEEAAGSLAEFVDELAARRAQYSESEPSITDESADAIRIMTIHGAKGLEFDTVILPDLAFSSKGDQLNVFATSAPRHLVFSGNLESFSAWAHRTPDGDELRQVRSGRETAEEERLFYVATTRAKAELVFVATENSRSSAGFMKHLHTIFGKDTLSSRLHPEGTPEARVLPVVGGEGSVEAWFEYAAADAAGAEPSRFRDARAARLIDDLSGIVPLDHVEPEPAREKVLGRAEASRRAAGGANRIAGILLHRFLEVWDDRPDSMESLLERLAIETGAEASEVDLVRRRLNKIQDSPTLARIRAMETVGRELSIHFIEHGRACEGRIDRLLRDGDRLLVVDYKSGRPDPVRLENDREQVRRYCSLIASRESRNVAGLLWYIDVDTDEGVDVSLA